MKTRAKWAVAACAVAAAVVAVVATVGSGEEREPRGGATAAPEPACPKPEADAVRRGTGDGRRVAITFDDGPTGATAEMLRVLERRDARATFFVLGREIPGHEEILRRAAAAGHELANHSTNHTLLPTEDDLALTNRLIAEATGERPCLFRPPQGRYDDRLLAAARRLGMTTVTWDVDTQDWISQAPTVIRDRVLAGVQPGSIVLMHDGGGERAGTAQSLAAVIDELRDRGYELVTVSELLRET